MKKEVKFFLLGMVSTFVLIGLIFGGKNLFNKFSKNSNSSEENKKTVIKGYEYSENKYDNNIVCDAFKDIKIKNENYILTNSNELYELNTEQKYSDTKQNCHKVADVKIKKILKMTRFSDGIYYLGEDNKVYRFTYNDESHKQELKEVGEYYTNERIITSIFNNDEIVSVEEIDEKSYSEKNIKIFNVLKTDGKIYTCEVESYTKYNQWSDTHEYINNLVKEEVKQEIKGETIKNYRLYDNEFDFIVTDKAIYITKVKNPKCNEYADVECEYEFVKEDYFSKKIKNVSYVDSISVYYDGNKIDHMTVEYYNNKGERISLSKTQKDQ